MNLGARGDSMAHHHGRHDTHVTAATVRTGQGFVPSRFDAESWSRPRQVKYSMAENLGDVDVGARGVDHDVFGLGG